MSQGDFHQPAMLEEVLAFLSGIPEGIVIDATVGGGGHAASILQTMPNQHLVGIDRDIEAINVSRERLATYGERARFVHARYDELSRVARQATIDLADVTGGVSAVLFDLGVSSHQLDDDQRGFSYRFDGPLDMRMDQSDGVRAEDLVNHASVETLESLFRDNGETRFAGRIARMIVSHRPIMTTGELAEVVASAVPIPARRRGHPARRVFQALRMAVNTELEILEPALRQAIDLVQPGGRVVVLAYHSGEDRIVKSIFRQAATGGCVCPPGLPCVCGAMPTVRLLTRGSRQASKAEIELNPRAKSARLRGVERLAVADRAEENS